MRILVHFCPATLAVAAMAFTCISLQRRNGVAAAPDEIVLNSFNQRTYGVDLTFPIHNAEVSTNYDWLPHNVDPVNFPTPPQYEGMPVQIFGEKQKWYDEFLQGCRDLYGMPKGRACDATEDDRIEMNLRQPQSMQNYTEMGFKKIKAPEEVFSLIKNFWNRNHMREKEEKWFTGNTYTNHWDNPTYMVSVEDTTLRGGGGALKQAIWDAAKSTLEEWTGEELSPCSLYGIRTYKEGALLAPHVDRLPLVSSAIINVAQDVDEPWPLEVYAHDGKAYNVTMEPGEMVLYESHSVVHGRPFPLKGRFYANIFIHFEPIGHSLRHGVGVGDGDGNDVTKQYRKATDNGHGGHEAAHEQGLPVYLIPGSPEVANWKRSHPGNWEASDATAFTTGSTPAHQAASAGDLETLKDIADSEKHLLHKSDKNGWQPIHEGARGGHKEVVELLVEHGVDPNKRTNRGLGPTPLHLAKEHHGDKHPVVSYLSSIGALDIGPEL